MTNLDEITPEYVFVTVPAEYICVYHRILAMLADYGEDMLKDCKAACTDRNSGVIECFNMFNAAVAARKLGKAKLASTLIEYVKAKINMIYGGDDNSTSFVFPIDETGSLKAFVSCGETPKFEIRPEDGTLYKHKFNNGFDEHFRLGPEDASEHEGYSSLSEGLSITFIPTYHDGYPCADVFAYYDGNEINLKDTTYSYTFDDQPVLRFDEIDNLEPGIHTFGISVTYNGETKVVVKELEYERREN